MMSKTRCTLVMFLLFMGAAVKAQLPASRIVIARTTAIPRVNYGVEQVSNALIREGFKTALTRQPGKGKLQQSIVAGTLHDTVVKTYLKTFQIDTANMGKEGFVIRRSGNLILVAGADPSGALYGCLELAEQIKQFKALPATIDIREKPQMVLRGTCVGIQKPYYLPGRTVYEYPYTPETFPWLYDKKLWLQYLDTLVANRYNSLYLWNGHPFASLVRLKDYPYAVEVDDATFKKNEDIYRFLTTEADKRGIWVIQMFYNIIVSKPFAEHHKIKTQDRERPIIPLIADYTRKSIAAFVEKYPNVGLLVCLGEAMEGVGRDDIDWFTKTIIPGVQDGLKALGRTDEPPIVLRAHDSDAPAVMKEALPLYKQLYTEAKYNGEALTTYTPRGPWAELHRTLSRIGTVQIENVHILANLEPFRYGSADFIQKSVQAMHSVYEANGLHLYPQASYWDWPYAADSTQSPLLLQVERDWLWYREWARYAWNANRDRVEEINYWAGLLAARYGCSLNDGKKILDAYEESGEIAPKLLRRFGITDGNRQTMTLGMTMPQLVNPNRFGLFTLLYNSEGPEGEMLSEYAAKEWQKQSHIGETPTQVIAEVKIHGQKALDAINAAEQNVTRNKEDFLLLKNDMLCYNALANHYAFKAQAALDALRYKYSNQLTDLQKVVKPLEESVDWYRKLTDLTKATYRYANSMQTQQRKIPFRGVNATYKNWWEVLPEFEKEVSRLKKRIDSLHTAKNKMTVAVNPVLQSAAVSLTSPASARYRLLKGARVFTDSTRTIAAIIPELQALEGITTSWAEQVQNGTTLTFTTTTPVKLLVGFFHTKAPGFLAAPELETNATANDYGQADVKIANAIILEGLPPVNIHTYSFKAGTHTLRLAKGVCLLLGFLPDQAPMRVYDAALQTTDGRKEVDWIFE